MDQIHLGGKEHTVESESESLARVVAVSEKLADIQVISQRHRQIGGINTERRRRLAVHEYLSTAGQGEIIPVEPAVGGSLYIELIECGLDICRIVAVEKPVAPTVGVDNESRELTHSRDGVQIKGYSTRLRHCHE